MNEEQISKLTSAASDTIKENGSDPNHTVGCAVLDKSGEIVTGVNMYHFTGGPCAEVVAISSAISQGKTELIAIAAVGDRDRGILAPCGRCRQVIFDYYPEMQVVTSSGELKSIAELLPDTYSWVENQL